MKQKNVKEVFHLMVKNKGLDYGINLHIWMSYCISDVLLKKR